MGVLQINQSEFQKEVLEHSGIVLVDFFATWCGPCRMTAPIIDELSQEKKEIKFVKIDVDQNSNLASQYNIFSIPTFIIFKEGKVVAQFSGALSKEGFLLELDKVK